MAIKWMHYISTEWCGMAVKSVSVRIEKEMLDKISYVADFEGRSINSHVLVLIRENIEAFEKKYGKIEGDIRPDINVKPSGKYEK